MNRAKEKLARGGTVLVFNPNFPSPSLVEHAGGLGFDVAFIAAVRESNRAAAGFNLHHWEEGPEIIAKGVRWITIHAKTMLARGTKDLFSKLGNTDGQR